jgi:GTP cyclohydrolase I
MDNYIRAILTHIGEDPYREGLRDTPKRVIKSWRELYSGYKEDPKTILKTTFIKGACKEMVLLKDIDYYSTCEHHILPFFGMVHIGYLPKDNVVGISKLARLVDCFSRRLQIQERMTTQIADSLMECLEPLGCMVIVEGQHFCMTARGVKKNNTIMKTSAIRGQFGDIEAREEFLNMIK